MSIEELTIDFKDYVKRCVKKWKFLLICMIIAGILFDFIGYANSVRNAKAVERQIAEQKKEKDENEKLETISEYMQKLSDREVSEVQAVVAAYKEYQQEYVDSLGYYQNSMKMKLDPSCVPTISLQYLIDNHYEVSYPVIAKKDTTEDIINAFIEKVSGDNVGSQVAEILNMKENASYAQELVSANVQADSYLQITVMAENKEECEKIAEMLKKVVSSETDAIKDIFGEFDITLTSEQYTEEANADLMAAQQQQMNSLNNLRLATSYLTNGMNDDQKNYYYALLDNENVVSSSVETDNTAALDISELTVPAITYINKLYIVLGVFLGLLGGCVWILVRYIMSGKLRVYKDMEELYGITVLGTVAKDTKESDCFEKMGVAIKGIQMIAKKEQMHTVFVTGTATTDSSDKISGKIKQALEKEEINVVIGQSMLISPESIGKMAASDGILLVEQIDVSRYAEIDKEKMFSCKCHVPIIGCVVIN